MRGCQPGEQTARLVVAAARPHHLQQHMLRELVSPVRRLDRERLDHDAVGDVGRRPSSDEVAQHARRLLGDAAGDALARY
eukprot:scaffold32815_cov69-Phaeocystis_antarctica.AAC.3